MDSMIVIADDEADLRMVYAQILRSEGHVVREASDGREALALVSAHRPQLLLLDVWMPGMNGFEVLDELLRDRLASPMKVVMLSNVGDADARLEAYSNGVADYISKGISLEDLLERVRRVLSELPIAGEST